MIAMLRIACLSMLCKDADVFVSLPRTFICYYEQSGRRTAIRETRGLSIKRSAWRRELMNDTLADEPLAGFRWFRTSDFDEARALVSRQFRDHVLDSLGTLRQLDTVQNSVRLQDVSLHYLDYGASVRVRADALDSFYLVVMPLTGRAKLVSGGVETVCDEGSAAILSTSRSFQIDWQSDCKTLIARVERAAVEKRLAGYIGSKPRHAIEFQPRLATDAGSGSLFKDTVKAIVRRLDAGDELRSSPILCGELEQLLLGTLLQRHDHNYSRILSGSPGRAPPRSAVAAAEYIETYADRAITLGDLSSAAGVGARALQQSFQQHYGLSPMEFLRRVRLMKVREELVRTEPASGATVTRIALKWGFSHLGRFSGLYQRCFGEPPSATLRR
jgi:AraC-like DNA-binding protein